MISEKNSETRLSVTGLLYRYNMELSHLDDEGFTAQCVLDPVTRGLGDRIGTSMRGILLDHLPGFTISGFSIPGVKSEYDTLSSVREDFVEVVMNLKEVHVSLTEDKDYVSFDVILKGKGVVYADVFSECPGLMILNPHVKIMTLIEDVELPMTLVVTRGVGFIASYSRHSFIQNYDQIVAIENISYSPVLSANYRIEPTETDKKNAERIIFDIKTKGGLVSPKEAFQMASHLLMEQISPLSMLRYVDEVQVPDPKPETAELLFNPFLMKEINKMSLGVRAESCLSSLKLKYVGDLLSYTGAELLQYDNFGHKSLASIQESLRALSEESRITLPHDASYTLTIELGKPHAGWNRTLAEEYLKKNNLGGVAS